MKTNQFPAGWDERHVREVFDYYENQTDQEAASEHEAALANPPLLSTDPVAQMVGADEFEPQPHDRVIRHTILDLEGSVQPKSKPEDFSRIRRQVAAARGHRRVEKSNE